MIDLSQLLSKAMEGENQKLITVLNGLVQINNDRIAGYHQASQETKDSDLEPFFESMLNESVNFAENLEAYIKEMGGQPTVSGTSKGKIHQAWMDFKAALPGNDRQRLLSSCEFGDKATIEAYETALKTKEIQQNEELTGVLSRQQATIENSIEIIKTLYPRITEQNALNLF